MNILTCLTLTTALLGFSVAADAELTRRRSFNESCSRKSDCSGNLDCYPREKWTFNDKVCTCPYTDWVWNNLDNCVRENCEYRIGWKSVTFKDPDSENCLIRLGVNWPVDQIRGNKIGCPGNSSFNTIGGEGWCSCNEGFTPVQDNKACLLPVDIPSVSLVTKKTYREVCATKAECGGNLDCLKTSEAWDVKVCACQNAAWFWNNSTRCVYKGCGYRIGWDGHVTFTDPESKSCKMKLDLPLLLTDVKENDLSCPSHSTLVKDASNQVGTCKCSTGFAPHPRKNHCEAFPGIYPSSPGVAPLN